MDPPVPQPLGEVGGIGAGGWIEGEKRTVLPTFALGSFEGFAETETPDGAPNGRHQAAIVGVERLQADLLQVLQGRDPRQHVEEGGRAEGVVPSGAAGGGRPEEALQVREPP